VSGMAKERVGLLIVRTAVDWGPPMRFRVRITEVVDSHELPSSTVTTVDDACAIVRTSLTRLLDADPPTSSWST